MTNKFVFENGKLIENFNYINPDDPYSDYIGNLIEYDGILYEVVTDFTGKLLNSEHDARIVSHGISEIYDHIDYLNTKPLPVSDEVYNKGSFEGDVLIEDGRIYYNGVEIIPDPEENESKSYTEYVNGQDSNGGLQTINYVDNRFF
jgi:hypothetical protein